MNTYFTMDETVFDVTERYPEIIRYLAEKGFTPLTNPVMRKLMGKKITLGKAFISKKLDLSICEKELVEIIEHAASSDFTRIDLGLKIKNDTPIESDDEKKNNKNRRRTPLSYTYTAFGTL